MCSVVLEILLLSLSGVVSQSDHRLKLIYLYAHLFLSPLQTLWLCRALAYSESRPIHYIQY